MIGARFENLSADIVVMHGAVRHLVERALDAGRWFFLRFDSQQSSQIAAENRFLVSIAQKVRIHYQINRIRPRERLVRSVDNLPCAHLGHEVSQTL
jgi:hypothetical protein